MSIAARYDSSNTPLCTLDIAPLTSLHAQLHSLISDPIITTPDSYILPIQLSTYVLTSSLLAMHTIPPDSPLSFQAPNSSFLTSYLRALLTTPNPTLLTSLPGAMLWIYAIGLCFSRVPGDRTWFLMQLLRVAHVWALGERWEEVVRSLDFALRGLEGARIGEVELGMICCARG